MNGDLKQVYELAKTESAYGKAMKKSLSIKVEQFNVSRKKGGCFYVLILYKIKTAIYELMVNLHVGKFEHP